MTRLQAGSPWFANAVHAAPTELDRAGGPLRYKYVAPTGACTDPCEDPCKEQGKRTAPVCRSATAQSNPDPSRCQRLWPSRLPTAGDGCVKHPFRVTKLGGRGKPEGVPGQPRGAGQNSSLPPEGGVPQPSGTPPSGGSAGGRRNLSCARNRAKSKVSRGEAFQWLIRWRGLEFVFCSMRL